MLPLMIIVYDVYYCSFHFMRVSMMNVFILFVLLYFTLLLMHVLYVHLITILITILLISILQPLHQHSTLLLQRSHSIPFHGPLILPPGEDTLLL